VGSGYCWEKIVLERLCPDPSCPTTGQILVTTALAEPPPRRTNGILAWMLGVGLLGVHLILDVGMDTLI